MTKRLLKRIKKVDDLNMVELEETQVGLEIQDFINPNLNNREIQEKIYEYNRKFKSWEGIKALHGPFMDLNPISPDKSIREITYERYKKTIEIAKELGVDYVIFHSQIYPEIMTPKIMKIFANENKKFWKWIIRDMDYDGTILIENIFEKDPYMLKKIMETIDMENVKLNLDIGHAKLGGLELEVWIKELRDYIEYVHIHTNSGIHDEHMAPTDDEIEHFYMLLDKYDLDPVLSLEYDVDDFKEEVERYK